MSGKAVINISKIVTAIIVVLLLFSAYRMINAENIVVGTLESRGYENVRIVNHSWWGIFHGCWGRGSRYFKATATNEGGKEVQVSVCYNLWTTTKELP